MRTGYPYAQNTWTVSHVTSHVTLIHAAQTDILTTHMDLIIAHAL